MTNTPNQSKNSFTIWPYAVVVCMVLFMGYIASFVYKAMNKDVNLVSQNYYQQEIAFQDHINTVGRTKAVGDVVIIYQKAKQIILLQLPESYKARKINGSIHLFRPSDSKLDQNILLQPGRDMSQLIEIATLKKGLWKIRVSFNADEQAYYTEKTIQLK